MVLRQYSRVIGIYCSREAAAQAFDQLIFSGFPIAKVFLIGNDLLVNEQSADTETIANLVEGKRAEAIASTATGFMKGLAVGNVSGGLIGLLLGVGVLALPGLGEAALISAIACTFLGSSLGTAVGGAIGALIDLGMTEKQARNYSERILQGDYLLVVKGADDEIECAEVLLKVQSIQNQEH